MDENTESPEEPTPYLLFDMGEVLATPGAYRFMIDYHIDDTVLLLRHASGDWGEIPEEGKAANERALKTGGRIVSGYTFEAGVVWIITKADRTYTTIMLSKGY